MINWAITRSHCNTYISGYYCKLLNQEHRQPHNNNSILVWFVYQQSSLWNGTELNCMRINGGVFWDAFSYWLIEFPSFRAFSGNGMATTDCIVPLSWNDLLATQNLLQIEWSKLRNCLSWESITDCNCEHSLWYFS